MSRLLKLKCLSALALIGAVASPLSAGAYAVNMLEPPARVVGFKDLDLTRQAGVQVLYTRIKSAAREVCEPLDAWTLRLLRQDLDCRADAIGRAVADVNSAALTTYYLTKTKARAAGTQQQ
jgi:UrcA family protein